MIIRTHKFGDVVNSKVGRFTTMFFLFKQIQKRAHSENKTYAGGSHNSARGRMIILPLKQFYKLENMPYNFNFNINLQHFS